MYNKFHTYTDINAIQENFSINFCQWCLITELDISRVRRCLDIISYIPIYVTQYR